MYRDPVPSLEAPGLLPAATRALRVGMIGIGTVGGGTFRVLARNPRLIAARAGRGIEITVIADLVDITRLHTADAAHRVPHLAFHPDAMQSLIHI